MRKALLILACVVLCMGQTCTGPAPAPSDQQPPQQNTPDQGAQQAAVVSAAQAASWQVFWGTADGFGFATAFAIDGNLLGTNAHVVTAIAQAFQRGGWASVVHNETGEELIVTQVWVHPFYNGDSSTTPDVGIIQVAGSLLATLPIAEADRLYALQVFDDLTMCGFPGDVTMAVDFANLAPGEVFRPRSTCLQGKITALRPFNPSEPSTSYNTKLVQHDLATTEGTSGSAILDLDGYVVAINAAATSNEAGLNRFAPRADTLSDLLAGVRDGSIAPLSLELVSPCSTLVFYDPTWRFGFNPPFGFTPTQGTGQGALARYEFNGPGGMMMFATVSLSPALDLPTALSGWVAVKTSSGQRLLSSNILSAPTGQSFALMEWFEDASGTGTAEVFAVSGGNLYQIYTFFFTSAQIVVYEAIMLDSLSTFCVE